MKIEEIIPGIIKVNEFPDIEVANIEYDIPINRTIYIFSIINDTLYISNEEEIWIAPKIKGLAIIKLILSLESI